MSSTTQRRSSVALLVLTIFVVSVDTANAVQRHAPLPTARASSTSADSNSGPMAHAQLIAAHAQRVKHKAAHRQHPRAADPPKRQVHATAPRRRIHPKPVQSRHAHRVARVTGPTGWSALDRAIARIPTYRPGAAMWLVSNRYGHWGTADWYHDTLYVAPGVPTSYLYDVAVHEWSHELSVLDYGGDVDAAVAAMNAAFGGSGLVGAERAADCMSRLQGASWTHYTSCANQGWRASAAKLVAGRRL